MRLPSGSIPGAVAGLLLLLLTGLPHLGVALADADFLTETLAPSALTRSLLTDAVHAAKPASGAPLPSERDPEAHPAPAHVPAANADRSVREARLPAPPWRRALRHCRSAQQSGCT